MHMHCAYVVHALCIARIAVNPKQNDLPFHAAAWIGQKAHEN